MEEYLQARHTNCLKLIIMSQFILLFKFFNKNTHIYRYILIHIHIYILLYIYITEKENNMLHSAKNGDC